MSIFLESPAIRVPNPDSQGMEAKFHVTQAMSQGRFFPPFQFLSTASSPAPRRIPIRVFRQAPESTPDAVYLPSLQQDLPVFSLHDSYPEITTRQR